MVDLLHWIRLLLAACLLPGWRRAVALVQPQTILRWHRLGFRLFWRLKSKPCPRDQVTSDTVGLIREMAAVLGGLHHDYRRAA